MLLHAEDYLYIPCLHIYSAQLDFFRHNWHIGLQSVYALFITWNFNSEIYAVWMHPQQISMSRIFKCDRAILNTINGQETNRDHWTIQSRLKGSFHSKHNYPSSIYPSLKNQLSGKSSNAGVRKKRRMSSSKVDKLN